MKLQNIFISLMLLLFTTLLNATVYEDGTNATNSWNVYDNTPTGASVTSIYDAEKSSDVIKLEGTGTQNGYKIGHWSGSAAWNNTTDKTLKLSMNFSENFYLFVSMQTTKGHRYLYYTAADTDIGLHSGSYIHHGVGAESKNGTWQTLTRDLEADLKEYESDNSIVSVNAMLVRGSGLFDDIELTNGEDTNIDELYTYYTIEEDDNVSVNPEGFGFVKYINIYKRNYLDEKIKIKIKKIDKSEYLDDTTNNIHEYGYRLSSYDSMTIDNITYFTVKTYTPPLTHRKYELWKTDGTEVGTRKLSQIYHTSHRYETAYAKFINYSNGKLNILNFHKLYSGDSYFDLWETDGTVAGTVRVERVVK